MTALVIVRHFSASGAAGNEAELTQTALAVQDSARELIRIAATSAVSTLLYLSMFLYTLLARPRDELVIRLSLALVIADGIFSIIVRAADVGVDGVGMFSFFITHVLACAVLPWRVSQAFLSAAIVFVVNAISVLLIERGFSGGAVVASIATAILGIPGTLIAWARHSRRLRGHQFRFLQHRYGEVRRELTDARRIHEAMFPVPVANGPVRLSYRYQPMRQIGGDFLHVERCESSGAISTVLLDVTGHGIPAALTVNRLYGELARIFAEDPNTAPSVVMSKLNRYVHLTMSQHSVFVTGVCVRIDPNSNVAEYANAGHPPSFHITADGRIHRLDSTGMVLGAVDDDRFSEEPMSLRFEAGDRLIAYTDGATEARNSEGQMLSVAGLQAILASPDPVAEGSWPSRLIEFVNHHRSGAPDDDTLVVELYAPVGGGR